MWVTDFYVMVCLLFWPVLEVSTHWHWQPFPRVAGSNAFLERRVRRTTENSWFEHRPRFVGSSVQSHTELFIGNLCMIFIYLCLLFFMYMKWMLLAFPLLKQIQLLEHMMPLFVAWNIAQRSMSWWRVAGTDQFDCGTQEHLAMLAPSLSQKRWSNRELSRTCTQAPCLNIHAMVRFNQKMACGQLLQINNV